MTDKLATRRIPYFGDFVLFDEIGRGGMGVVYSAQQTKLDRPVALKVLHADPGASDGRVQRLRIEAEATARLDHPNIVPVFEFGQHEGHPYLAMQLVEGKSLAEHIRCRGPELKERDAALLLVKIARAVHHAHQRGVLHRDLKPGNILLDESGEPHLIDFGLAKCLEQDSGLTQTGAFLGTPAYASPEQAAGQNKSVTTASDIYSLGAVLYALLTGQPPFVGESTAEIIEKVKGGNPRRLRSIRSSLSADLEIVCLKCLEKEPARRYATALELAEDIERFLDGRPIAARPVGTFEQLWMWTRRNPVHAALGITVVLVVLASIVSVFLWREARAKDAEARSQILELQVTRLTPHNDGWSARAWSRANEATKIQTPVKSGDIRNQATAILAGLDAHRVEPFTNFGASSVLFDRAGTRLLIGGLDDGAKLWDGRTRELQILSRTDSGPLAFADGSPVELRYDPIRRALVLGELGDSRTRQEWRIPERNLTTELGTNAPALTVLTPDAVSAAAELALADGKHVVIAFHSNTFHLVAVLDSSIARLAISPDGSLVAVAQSENRISVWPVSGGPSVAELATDRNEVLCLAFKRTRRVPESRNPARDGAWLLAAGDAGGNVTLWDLHTGSAKTHYRGGHYGVSAIALNPDGTILASGGRGPVKLWEVATGGLLLDVEVGGSGEYITGLDFTPDGKRLAISTKKGSRLPDHVSIWELEFGRGIQTLHGLSGQISKVCFSADGQKVAALSHDWEVGIWDLATGQLLRIFEVPTAEFADNATLAFDSSGQRLAFAASRAAKMWNVESGAELKSWPLWPGLADAMVFPDENHLLLGRVETSDGKRAPDSAAREAGDPCVFRIRNLLASDWPSPVAADPDFNWRVSNAAVSRDGRFFVVEGEQGDASERRMMIKAYDSFTGKELWRNPFTRGRPSGAITIAATGQFVAFQTDDTTNAVLVDLASGSPIKTLPWMPAAISPKGEYYAVRALGRGISLFKDTNSIPIITLGIDGGDSAVNPQFDRAGNQLAWGDMDGTVTVCDLKEVRHRLVPLGLAW